jgi:hypothetical protein
MSENDLVTVPVNVQNWKDKPSVFTTVKTWILDSTGVAGPNNVQICDDECYRISMIVKPIDQDIAITTDVPVHSPDTSSATVAPQGAHISKGDDPWVFGGTGPMWINTVTVATRVVVVKEYESRR